MILCPTNIIYLSLSISDSKVDRGVVTSLVDFLVVLDKRFYYICVVNETNL